MKKLHLYEAWYGNLKDYTLSFESLSLPFNAEGPVSAVKVLNKRDTFEKVIHKHLFEEKHYSLSYCKKYKNTTCDLNTMFDWLEVHEKDTGRIFYFKKLVSM